MLLRLPKLIILLSLFFSVAGCGPVAETVLREKGGIEKEKTFYLGVSSNPPDADIYINDKLVGKTPSYSIPLSAQYNCVMNLFSWRVCSPVEQYLLRVSKPGYRDSETDIRFTKWQDGTPNGYYVPVKTAYHFELEPDTATEE